MIRVLVVEDVPLFRCGIRAVLEQTGECLVLEATELAEIAALAHLQQQPDVAILSGALTSAAPSLVVHLLRQQAPSMGIMILAPSQNEERLFHFVKVGASSYELRTLTQEALIEKVRRVSRGEYLITSEVLLPPPQLELLLPTRLEQGTQQQTANPGGTSASPLSSRELEVVGYIAGGHSNKEIARALNISDQTVKNHITSTLKKLHVTDRTSAVVCALRQGWIPLQAVGREDR